MKKLFFCIYLYFNYTSSLLFVPSIWVHFDNWQLLDRLRGKFFQFSRGYEKKKFLKGAGPIDSYEKRGGAKSIKEQRI